MHRHTPEQWLKGCVIDHPHETLGDMVLKKNGEGLKVKSDRVFPGRQKPAKREAASADDPCLWQDFIMGSEEAYEKIYKKFSPELYSYGLNICRDKELVEDCLHDLFIYIYQHRSGLGYTDSIKYYLFRSLKRKIALCVNLKEKLMGSEDIAMIIRSQTSSFLEHQMEVSEHVCKRKAIILRALNQLSNRQKEIIHLLYYNNLSHQEVSQVMDIEIRTVYNQVHNAISSLKSVLSRSSFY